MVNIIVELSKYLMILLMGIYTFSCFSVFAHNYESEQKWILIRQNVLMFLLQLTAYVVMYLKKERKLRRLSSSWAIDAQGRLLEELYTLLGEKNVKVVQKTIEKRDKID